MTNKATSFNIIVIILDAVRAAALSCYGHGVETTPNLDEFAARSLMFKRAFAPATWTVPTHASMLSGLYLSEHRLENIAGDRAFNRQIVTLPEALERSGYHTAAFSQNFLFAPSHNLAGNFREFYPLWNTMPRTRPEQGERRGWRGRMLQLRQAAGRYQSKRAGLSRAMDTMLDWLIRQTDAAPVFLMANITNAHYPWAPPPKDVWGRLGRDSRHLINQELAQPRPFQFNSGKIGLTGTHRRVWRGLYEAAVMHVDRELGRFLGNLRRWPGWANSIVFITADHGELLGEFQDIVGHTLCLHDNLLHVPLLVRHPDYETPATVEGVVQNMDMFSSIVKWAGVDESQVAMPPAQLQRPSLSEALAQPHSSSGYAFAEEDYTDSYNPVNGLLKVNPELDPHKFPQRQIAVRSSTHKLVWFDDRPAVFYDLAAGLGEEQDLLDSDTNEARHHLRVHQDVLAEWRADLKLFPPRMADKPARPEAEVTERLRMLGYVA